ncbi:MAG: sulfatase [Bryobacteraceae bacterium]|nr:sulfatase [Bryobacteraceae bacterium]
MDLTGYNIEVSPARYDDNPMLTRRQWLTGAVASTATGAPEKPNVLFLSVDDMNDWVGCLNGYPGVQTPNIDALAKRGVLFANAHCASPLCNPSRTALLTGLAASTTGIYNNEQYWKPNLPDVVSLPAYFKQNGYHVAGVGKVFHHVAGFNSPAEWDEFQLQEFDDPWYRRADWYPWVKKIPAPSGHPYNGLKNFQGEFDWGVLPKSEEAYGDMQAVNWGSQFLNRKHDKPFFLALGLWHPHIPMFAPQSYFDLYPASKIRLPEAPENDLDDVPAIAKQLAAARQEEYDRIAKEGKAADAVRAYLASISFADAMIGRVLKSLESSASAKNTIIVFWSDNGWHLGEKKHWHKSTLWERSTHVPMIFAGPGVGDTGQPRTQPANLLDIYPTLIEMCGLPRKTDLDGKSLMPVLKSSRAKRNPTVSTFLPGNHAVRSERWRYIRYSDGTEELYDTTDDRNEFHNLASQPKHSKLKQDLARWMPKVSAPPKPERDQFDFDFSSYKWSRKR